MGQVHYEGNLHWVYELRLRDGDEAFICPWCKRPMDPTRAARERQDPRSVTIEHIVPLTQGGKWELSNMVLACLGCNQTRGRMTSGKRGLDTP